MALRQFLAALNKVVRLKTAHWVETSLEILLPVAFLALLLLFKGLADQYESPNIAYFCGNTFPWYGTDSITDSPGEVPELAQCALKPDTCTSSSYYRERVNVEIAGAEFSLSAYLGFVESDRRFPFYTYTVGDTSSVFFEVDQLQNPSLPFHTVINKMASYNALFVVAPHKALDELTQQAQNLASYLQQRVLQERPQTTADAIVVFESERKLENYVTNDKYDNKNYRDGKVGMAVVVDNFDAEQHKWEYTIRMNYSYPWDENEDTVTCLYGCGFQYTIPSTRVDTDDLTKPQTMDYLYGYSYSGFVAVQQTIDQYIFLQETGQDVDVQASISLMATKKYDTDNFWQVIAQFLGFFLILGFLYPVSRFGRELVHEKEYKLKDTQIMMGLSPSAYFWSWLLVLLGELLISCILITAVVGPTVFLRSDKGLVFLFFFVFSLSVLAYTFLIGALFGKGKTAALIAPAVFFITFFPYFGVTGPNYSTSTKVSACLLAPTCVALGGDVFGRFESGLVGVQLTNANEEVDNISYSLVVGMMIVDTVIYSLLAWYFSQVTGRGRLSWYFLCYPPLWFHRHAKPTSSESAEHQANVEEIPHTLKQQMAEHRCIQVAGLRKVFGGKHDGVVAVDGVHMEMFENQITALLGHNGAGKSTLISMLTGLLEPTAGTAWIRGNNIQTDMRAIEKDLGLCHQYNTIYPELTVMQHLTMFAAFKRVPESEIYAAAKLMAKEVGLSDKVDVESKKLSGGMKRKLCLGIALIGDAKVVILDEPTSGMDPYSRRAVWEFLQRKKVGRIIVLTTHYMDEADYLGDRIAIMAKGHLKCFGSPMYLKNLYGVGYTLTVAKEESQVGSTSHAIDQAILPVIPGAELVSHAGAEQSYRLPFAESARFPQLFEDLEARKQDLGIESYGIGVTTIEEVFLRVERDAEQGAVVAEEVPESEVKSNAEPVPVAQAVVPLEETKEAYVEEIPAQAHFEVEDQRVYNGYSHEKAIQRNKLHAFFVHFAALSRKRMLSARRDKKMFCCQLVIPTILVILGLGLLQLQPNENMPSLKLTPNIQNDDFPKRQRNPVPMNAMGTVGQGIQSRFNNEDVAGYFVPMEPAPDKFHGCAQGAAPLDDMSNFLLDSLDEDDEHGASRYGAITIASNSSASSLQYNTMVNGSSVHGAAIYPNLVHTAFLQEMLQNTDAEIVVKSHPLPRTLRQDRQSASFSALTVALFLAIAFAFIPASFAAFVVKEREVKAKHQQLVSGVSLPAYWLSTFVWDYATYLVSAGVAIGLIYAFDVDSFTQNEGAIAIVVVFVCFGPALAAFTYVLTFAFTRHTTAQNAVLFINFITGLCLMVVVFVLTLIQLSVEQSRILRYVFRIFPPYCFGDALLYIATCQEGSRCPQLGSDGFTDTDTISPFNLDIALADILFLVIMTFVYLALVFIIESTPADCGLLHQDPRNMLKAALSFGSRRRSDSHSSVDQEDDSDVVQERHRVLNGDAADDVVQLFELSKVYDKRKVAVKPLSFAVHQGECFGFLGTNGAGKTTALSILSGEMAPTSGTATIAGYDILTEHKKVRHKIGYCPQFDALFDLLTVQEHLQLYATIKGIPPDMMEHEEHYLIKSLGLDSHVKKQARQLSGGNRRKLSVAIALLGRPPIVFLDEPSSGMDPGARRQLWDVITRVSTEEQHTAVILTTHSMEEAEALCTRIAIMVNGRLRCLGSSQHLKAKFGSGYEAEVRVKPPTEDQMKAIARQLAAIGAVASSEDRMLEGWLARSVEECAEALGNPQRAEEISAEGQGMLLFQELQSGSSILARSFCEWWLNMEFKASLDRFMLEHFQSTHDIEDEDLTQRLYRYQIREATEAAMGLAGMFATLEAGKSDAHIEEYSLRQTTLEQVFNQFARQQDSAHHQ